MPTVLITGANGSIGRNLCRHFNKKGWRVLALGRSLDAKAETSLDPWDRGLRGDVSDPRAVESVGESLSNESIQVICHLAGKAHALAELQQDPDIYDRINAEGSRNMARLGETLGVQTFILASSIKAMGEGSSQAQTEEDECQPCTPYGRSKLRAEEFVAAESKRQHWVVLRLSMVYGSSSRGNMPRMIRAIRRHRFPPFPETHNRRSMVHMQDVMQSFWLGATHQNAPQQTFIVTDGKEYSTRHIYLAIRNALSMSEPIFTPPLRLFRWAASAGDTLGRVLGRRMPLDTDTLAKLTDSAAYSSEKISQMLGYRAAWTLERALPHMVDPEGT